MYICIHRPLSLSLWLPLWCSLAAGVEVTGSEATAKQGVKAAAPREPHLWGLPWALGPPPFAVPMSPHSRPGAFFKRDLNLGR